MNPATKLNEVAPSLFGWSTFQTQWKVDFNSYVLCTPEGLLLIDPTMPAPPVLTKLEALGEPLAIVLTNAHHDRDADAFRKLYGVQIYANEKAQSDCDTKIDVLTVDGEKLPGGLKTIFLTGVTTGEMALFTKNNGGILLIGDALLNPPGKRLQLLPAQFIEDKKQARVSLLKLLDFNFKIATFGHGEPLTKNAKKAIAAFLRKH